MFGVLDLVWLNKSYESTSLFDGGGVDGRGVVSFIDVFMLFLNGVVGRGVRRGRPRVRSSPLRPVPSPPPSLKGKRGRESFE